jgi:2-amino-4-hydroxy-6-hydroxymethyldihydropteridine diphosphokinase
MPGPGHQVCLLLGSNIRPEYNLPLAVARLRQDLIVLRISSVWESAPVGGKGSNYLNAALLAISQIDAGVLKQKILLPLEVLMGRKRTTDKNFPRPIDLDIIFFDQELMDPTLWLYAHRAVPVSEILPDYLSELGRPLKEAAARLNASNPLRMRKDVLL